MSTLIETKCQAQWDDAEHRTLPGQYLVQTHPRIRNGAPPILLCWRCVAEWRANDFGNGNRLIAWIRSL